MKLLLFARILLPKHETNGFCHHKIWRKDEQVTTVASARAATSGKT
jgi:hypothetical protein